jgi:hypothetical protein
VSSSVWIVLIVAALVVAGIGVQALLSQRASSDRADEMDRQQACQNQWAVDLTEVIELRSQGNADVRAATLRKNAADDAVTAVFVEAFLTKPRPSNDVLEQHFTEALEEFQEAKKNLQIVSGTVENQQAKNPYPTLDLDCTPRDQK